MRVTNKISKLLIALALVALGSSLAFGQPAVQSVSPAAQSTKGAEVKGAPSLYEFTQGGALVFNY